jgi:hypothetical protein
MESTGMQNYLGFGEMDGVNESLPILETSKESMPRLVGAETSGPDARRLFQITIF